MSFEKPTIEAGPMNPKHQKEYPSSTEREIVEDVERLSVPDNVKEDLLLVWSGLKFATEMEYGKRWAPNESPQELSEEEIAQYKEVISRIGLQISEPIRERREAREVTEGEEESYIEYGQDIVRFYVAKDKVTAEQLKTAGQTDDDRTYGELSGFPATAVDAYVISENLPEGAASAIISREDLPEEVRNQDFMAFGEFMFSREYWQDEIETVKRWSEEIKRIDPKLYMRVVQSYQAILSRE